MIGKDVLVRIGGSDESQTLRKGIVTFVWGPDCLNLQVFLDPQDAGKDLPGTVLSALKPSTGKRPEEVPFALVLTSAMRGKGIGQWREIK